MIPKNIKFFIFIFIIFNKINNVLSSTNNLIFSNFTTLNVLINTTYDQYPLNVTLYQDSNNTIPQYTIFFQCKNYSNPDFRYNLLCTAFVDPSETYKVWGITLDCCMHFPKKPMICKYEINSITNFVFRVTNFSISGKISTRGSELVVTGNFLRIGTPRLDKLFYQDPTMVYPQYLDVTAGTINGVYNPNILNIKFPPGYGHVSLYFSSNYDINVFDIPYMDPSIKNTSFDYKNNQITIIGDNFFNDTSITTIVFGNQIFDKNNIASVDHEKIVFNYSTEYSQSINMNVSIETLTSNTIIVSISPVLNSYYTNVTRYNDGIVIINGTHLIQDPNSMDIVNLTVTIGNQNCIVIDDNKSSTSITCKLSNNNWVPNKVPIIVCSGGACSSTKLLYEYSKPIISSITSNDTSFTIIGKYLGSFNNNSTKIYINYDQSLQLIISSYDNQSINHVSSISNDETTLTFNVSYFCGSANFIVNVDGSNSSMLSFVPKTFINVTGKPSVDGVDKLLISFSFFECNNYKSTSNAVLIINSTSINGNHIKNELYSFDYGKGTGFINGSVKFGDQNFDIITSYQNPTVYKSIIQDSLVTLDGRNFGNSSNLCSISYNGTNANCVVLNDKQLQFNLTSKQVAFNLTILIDGIKGEYTLKSVECNTFLQLSSYSTSFGCSEVSYVSYYCNNLDSFINDDNKVLSATFEGISINGINNNGNNVSVSIPNGSSNSKLKLYLDNIIIASTNIIRKSANISHSTLLNDQIGNNIKFTINGLNFGNPFEIKIPNLNISLNDSNCTIVYHGTNKSSNGVIDQYCQTDSFICSISQQYKHLFNNITNIEYSIQVGNNILNSTSTVDTKRESNGSNKKNISTIVGAVIGSVIGFAVLCTVGVFAYKYHQNNISKNPKTKNV